MPRVSTVVGFGCHEPRVQWGSGGTRGLSARDSGGTGSKLPARRAGGGRTAAETCRRSPGARILSRACLGGNPFPRADLLVRESLPACTLARRLRSGLRSAGEAPAATRRGGFHLPYRDCRWHPAAASCQRHPASRPPRARQSRALPYCGERRRVVVRSSPTRQSRASPYWLVQRICGPARWKLSQNRTSVVFVQCCMLTFTDEQLDWIAERIPDARVSPKGGRPVADKRRTLRGIFWMLDNGAKWKDLPPEFGSKSTVHRWFARWVADGVFERLLQSAGRCGATVAAGRSSGASRGSRTSAGCASAGEQPEHPDGGQTAAAPGRRPLESARPPAPTAGGFKASNASFDDGGRPLVHKHVVSQPT